MEMQDIIREKTINNIMTSEARKEVSRTIKYTKKEKQNELNWIRVGKEEYDSNGMLALDKYGQTRYKYQAFHGLKIKKELLKSNREHLR